MLGPLGMFGFGAPWVLAALIALPAVWYLLRVVPPAPRRLAFPPLRLLMGLSAREDSAARTPPWLLLLRLLAVLLAILGLAQPVLNPQPGVAGGDRPLLLVIDDDWAAAPTWDDRQEVLNSLLDRAALQDQAVMLLTTAPPADGGPVTLGRMGTPEDAREQIRSLEPKPWGPDHAAAAVLLNDLGAFDAVMVSGGVRHEGTNDLLDALRRHGPVTLVEPGPGETSLTLGPPERTPDGLTVTVHRPTAPALPPRAAVVQALDDKGRPVGAGPVSFAADMATAEAHILLPADLRSTLARIEVRPAGSLGAPGAAAVLLLDDSWQRRPVAVVPGERERAGVPLLSDTYYMHRALEPFAEVSETTLAEALEQRVSIIMVAGGGRLSDTATDQLVPWVEQGGVLVRFAGPQIAQGSRADPLLPVALRGGGRTLGGVLSWAQPASLAPFPDESPFAGLDIPPEVTVTSQVLAEPSVDLPQRTWAQLSDGTPLVTGVRRGQGWVVLVHTTANAEWSNLALSGLFPDMLRRLTALGQGTGDGSEDAVGAAPQPPLELLDGFGRLGDPPPTARALTGEVTITPANPPGYYGRADQRTALNLSGAEDPPPGLGALPAGVERLGFGPMAQAVDLRPWFLGTALTLLLIDLLISYGLRGLLNRRAAAAAVLALVAVLTAPPVAAQQGGDDALALEAALNTRLAFVRTGLGTVDQVAQEGLGALTTVLGQRSSAELAPPLPLDINRDELAFFPLLYWPAADGQEMPDAAARGRVNDFLNRGGMILFDGRGPENAEALRVLLQTLDIPPLAPLPKDHVATRSFYLLPGLPGRIDGGPVWISQSAAGGDAVSPVIIGSGDWAGAWARDSAGRPRLPVIPGGERGRELAYRSGINMVMYALTGNYKADQVHLPAILERLTQ